MTTLFKTHTHTFTQMHRKKVLKLTDQRSANIFSVKNQGVTTSGFGGHRFGTATQLCHDSMKAGIYTVSMNSMATFQQLFIYGN